MLDAMAIPATATAFTGSGLDFITVIFRPELDMLRLQARSMARFFKPEDVNSILVVLNDEDEAACRRGVEALLPEWGALAGRVQIIAGSSLLHRVHTGPLARLERIWVSGLRCAWRPWRDRMQGKPRVIYGWARNNGWLMQQAFKLLAVYRASGRYVVILDAKNIFIRPTDASEFVDAEGRPRVEPATQSGLYLEWAEKSAKRLGAVVPDKAAIPPSLTPVIHRRDAMLEAVKYIEDQLGDLGCFFARRSAKSTEFMLLYAAMSMGNADWMRAFSVRNTAPIVRVSGAAELEQALKEIRQTPPAMLSLHRKALRKLPADTRADLLTWLRGISLLRQDETAEGIFDV